MATNTSTALATLQANFNLQGQKALVTASTSGLGWGIAQALAAHGAKLLLNGRNFERLYERKQQLEALGATVQVWQQDIFDTRSLADSFAEHCADIQILVNTAGARLRKSFSQLSSTEIVQHIQQNLSATVVLSSLAATTMAQQGYGRIVTISSIAGRIARAGDAVYPIAKQGLEAMVRSLAVEFATQGVVSNGIAPGTFATESNQALVADPQKGQHVLYRNPMKRWAQVDEIAGAAVFLASPAASYVNGHVLVVDGGLSINF